MVSRPSNIPKASQAVDVTIAVCTYGDDEWIDLAERRALPSARDQAPTAHFHADNLTDARNAALEYADTEWIVYLDADDELEPHYIDHMELLVGADLIAPMVRYVQPNGHSRAPFYPRVAGHRHDCEAACLRQGNWLVVGTAVRVELARKVRGWRDFPWSEDWDLWLRCWRAGATIERAESVYRAHVRPDSRNRAPSRQFKDDVHRAIYAANYGESA